MANKKIRQEINLTNVTADPVDSVELNYGASGVVKRYSNNFNNSTGYF